LGEGGVRGALLLKSFRMENSRELFQPIDDTR
jgi:hypothetical protein